jgi:hypothetical protein
MRASRSLPPHARFGTLGSKRQLLALAEQSADIYRQLLELVTNRRQAGKDSDSTWSIRGPS